MKREEKLSYFMLFCGLLLVRNSRITMEELAASVPLTGNARILAAEITR